MGNCLIKKYNNNFPVAEKNCMVDISNEEIGLLKNTWKKIQKENIKLFGENIMIK